ncbi:hypothetical protein CEXT_121141 [Caerostris extrusa]|uniref:Uncharacterized protein n=1 Tax=Caerostris extrusa TaxID=172846 RepID=A0AAV4Q5H0_CAEEX|nr:hypothetical protein CEXT_121141 [Caerostris extrusa]
MLLVGKRGLCCGSPANEVVTVLYLVAAVINSRSFPKGSVGREAEITGEKSHLLLLSVEKCFLWSNRGTPCPRLDNYVRPWKIN